MTGRRRSPNGRSACELAESVRLLSGRPPWRMRVGWRSRPEAGRRRAAAAPVAAAGTGRRGRLWWSSAACPDGGRVSSSQKSEEGRVGAVVTGHA